MKHGHCPTSNIIERGKRLFGLDVWAKGSLCLRAEARLLFFFNTCFNLILSKCLVWLKAKN